MKRLTWKSFVLSFLKLTILYFCFFPLLPKAHAIDEYLDVYNAPQALYMGNAIAADAFGYLATFHNPAGLAKMPSRRTEVHLLALEGVASANGLGRAFDTRSFKLYETLNALQSRPGAYTFTRYGAIPALSVRGFSASLILNHQMAAQSDGTNVNVNARYDVGGAVGVASNFAGNLVKVGVSGVFLIRNELSGTAIPHATLNSTAAVASAMSEGFGIGINAGLLVTLPIKYLPTFAVVAQDLLGTTYSATNIMNGSASGTPTATTRSINAAFSLSPRFSRKWRTKFSAEIKHLEDSASPLRKKLHFGFQLQSKKRWRRFFLWLGLNQMYPTGGVGLWLPGGNLSLGTYAQDIGAGATTDGHRRFMMRYTVSFF